MWVSSYILLENVIKEIISKLNIRYRFLMKKQFDTGGMSSL
jgi:hypothetical protein